MHSHRRFFRRFFATALAGLGLAAIPAAAQAQPLNSVAIRTSVSGGYLVLDVKGGSTRAGAEVIQWYGHGGSNQRWNFVPLGNGNQKIVNQNSGMCLAVSSVAGRSLFQWYCNSDPQEEWHGDLGYAFGDGFTAGRSLTNPATGYAVDIAGSNPWAGASAIGWYDNDTQNQHFSYWQL
jgi:hypothetical protein